MNTNISKLLVFDSLRLSQMDDFQDVALAAVPQIVSPFQTRLAVYYPHFTTPGIQPRPYRRMVSPQRQAYSPNGKGLQPQGTQTSPRGQPFSPHSLLS